MGKIAVIECTSLDGVVQGSGHAGEDTDSGFQQGGWTGPFTSRPRSAGEQDRYERIRAVRSHTAHG